MTKEQVPEFIERIDRLKPDSQPQFGDMNVQQMMCHCADQIRHAIGDRILNPMPEIDPSEIIRLAKEGKTVPTPKGLGQVEGDGTAPTDFDTDKQHLKDCINTFVNLPREINPPAHPYFGDINYDRWTNLVVYHLNHHLGQFGV